jgi:2-haloacid dehalogenase
MAIEGVKALTFDVFGTVVDWFGSIVREGHRLETGGVQADWPVVASKWAEKYGAALSKPWRRLDEVFREGGKELVAEVPIHGLTGPALDHWADLWSRLDPWPDAVPGLTRIRQRYRLAPLSNANRDLSKALADHGGLPWNLIIEPDQIRVYKPDGKVYQNALRTLGLAGPDVMMVAAHLFDLKAAKGHGFRTAFIRRPGEETEDPTQAPYVDLIANDLLDLAARLSA